MCRWFGQNNYCPGLWKVAQRIKNHPIWSHCMEPINCWFCLIDILLICSASPSYKTLNLICVQFLLCLLPGLSSSESKKQAVQGFELTTSTGSNLFYYLNLRNEMEEATRELLVAVGQVLTSEIRSRIPSSRVSSIPLTPTRLIVWIKYQIFLGSSSMATLHICMCDFDANYQRGFWCNWQKYYYQLGSP